MVHCGTWYMVKNNNNIPITPHLLTLKYMDVRRERNTLIYRKLSVSLVCHRFNLLGFK